MATIINIMIFLILCVAATSCASSVGRMASCNKESCEFMANPSERTILLLSDKGENECWHAVASSGEKLNRLNNVIASGNEWAARYLLKHIKELDGGALEDALIALGRFFDKSPQVFLEFSRRGEMTERQQKDALTMLPLDLSDDLQAQLEIISKRRHRLLGIDTPALSSQKMVALEAIDAYEAQIKQAMKP